MMQAEHEAEIEQNFQYFQSVVGTLMSKHKGEYALIRDCEVVSYFKSSALALITGHDKFPDGLFSVQEVIDRPVDLGFYSHVANIGKA